MFLYYIFITPIEKILEWVFYYFVKIDCSVFVAIFGVSIVMNFLALPLYRIADALQKKERDAVRRMEPMVQHIRKTFSGDERFMMLSTYYRQNHYHPLYVIRGSLSILITVPFFIAGYHFLSHCPELIGQKFWIFKDLGSPDKTWMFKLFGLNIVINILPIIMTLINVISSAIYTHGGTVKEKIQVHALSLIFLVLLYNSPSGLVIYWILNNIFSLVKNMVLEREETKQMLLNFIGIMMAFVSWVKKIVEKIISLLKNLSLSSKRLFVDQNISFKKSDLPVFIFSSVGLALLIGFLLPANVISSSPLEFSFLGSTSSPFSYIYSSLFICLGLCVCWPMCMYFMFGDKTKFVLTVSFFTLLICAICNAYIFKPDYGELNPLFLLDESKSKLTVPFYYSVLSVLIAVFTVFVFYIFRFYNKQRILSVLAFSLCLGMFTLGIYKCVLIQKEYVYYCNQKEKEGIIRSDKIDPIYHLSKDKQNVVVLFLDRALGFFVPYIMKEFPDLEQRFDGFTFYPNTISFGRFTNTGSPSLMAGYEYTPDKINERKSELLKDKHNEAMTVPAKLFFDAGFDVTMTNVPWLNYFHESDYSYFDKYPGIKCFGAIGMHWQYYYKNKSISMQSQDNKIDDICRSKMPFFSIVQVLFPPLRQSFSYVSSGSIKSDKQKRTIFINNLSHMMLLRNYTDFSSEKNTFTMIRSNITHEYASLNVPNYDTVSETEDVDYHGYIPAFKSSKKATNQGYQVNVAALLQVAKWLDYLKVNNVYDNTRIIIVADHGRNLSEKGKIFPKFGGDKPSSLPASYNCLFMFKDFNNSGKLKTDDTFMTNADTLFLAKKDLNISDINPFTGKKLVEEKDGGVVVQEDHNSWNASEQKNYKTFKETENSWHVKGDIYDPKNWTKIENKK
ncbi:MAG: membrane protein insertase YidC [Spirochaetales bacterium]|nr:membrane protein insertase YidC [Spirochaetales bacterium]